MTKRRIGRRIVGREKKKIKVKPKPKQFAWEKFLNENSIFYTVPENFRNIHLMGIRHGQFFRPQGRTIFPFMRQKFNELGKTTIVLSEGKLGFLPKELRLVAEKMSFHMDPRPDMFLKNISKLKVARDLAKSFVGELLWFRKKNSVYRGQLNKKEIKETIKEIKKYFRKDTPLSSSEINELLSFITTYRSFLMAKRIIASVRRHSGKPHMVVVGAVHAAQIQTFIENSELMKRYSRFVEKAES